MNHQNFDEGSEVQISLGPVTLSGTLVLPEDAIGVVIFAHGSGSGRHSPRNQFVARMLRESRMGTLLFDLLTEEEEAVDNLTRHLRFDIPLLASRLVAVTDWVSRTFRERNLVIGYFGASTGAAAALIAAAERSDLISAVVSRGGRPDLAGAYLPKVRAPTLLIVGERDEPVIDLNEEAKSRMTHATTRIEIIPRATHLFEEPGTLDRVADLARNWLFSHFRANTTKAAHTDTNRDMGMGHPY